MEIAALITLLDYPQKDSVDKPLYDYEKIIFDSLVTHDGNKHLWIKKATCLGVSEFMLRFMAWLCLRDNALTGSQMCIVTGPRIDLAIALIDRMKKLFASSKGIAATFDTKETVIELNGVKVEAFPSHHLDAMRGLPCLSYC
jgi:late competence protein required for DNA uptake (superfamily II DNA/RNA helicase)